MSGKPIEQFAGRKRFKIQVAHPKNGAESSIVIHASSSEEAARLANAAGLLVSSVTPVSDAIVDVERNRPGDSVWEQQIAQTRQPPRSPPPLGAMIDLISWAYGLAGPCTMIYGFFCATAGGNHSAQTTIGVGLFMTATFAAYKWYWRDQEPWR